MGRRMDDQKADSSRRLKGGLEGIHQRSQGCCLKGCKPRGHPPPPFPSVYHSGPHSGGRGSGLRPGYRESATQPHSLFAVAMRNDIVALMQ